VKGDFHEDLQSDKRDPVDAQSQEFDWQRLYERLSEDAIDDGQEQRLAETVTRLLQTLIPLRERYLPPIEIGLNVIALAWVLNPAYFEGSPSLRQLARRCGVHPATLARHTGRFSRLIGWRNRAQRHAWNWREDQRSPLGAEGEKKADNRQT
jgi:AraC-like DNA-binding protein